MQNLSSFSQITLFVMLGIMGLYSVVVFIWQILVLKGRAMKNVDGSYDDWHQQKTHFGIAFADVFLACPANFLGIILVFLSPRWGFYILSLASFWWLWANVMTTATSLRFEHPKITLNWFITFPLGALIGLAYIIWTVLYFELIYTV